MLKHEDGFYLLRPRAFGLRQHFRLPEGLWEQVRTDFHDLLCRENRPVSTSEAVNKRLFEWTMQTNAYEAAQILREDNRFSDLGKFLFALDEWGIAEREHIHDIIPKVIDSAARPLTAGEIAEGVQRFRSFSAASIPLTLRDHEALRNYGFGYYGLKSWGEKVRHQLFAKSDFVNRAIARTEPPLTFGRLCEILDAPQAGEHADRCGAQYVRFARLKPSQRGNLPRRCSFIKVGVSKKRCARRHKARQHHHTLCAHPDNLFRFRLRSPPAPFRFLFPHLDLSAR